MPSTPTTKAQVQAYRFVLRRMQSALVRKDAVMLHDPMRTHTRATVVGVCIAAIGMVGFLIWGILSPKPGAPSEDGIVIGKPSGAVYVLITKPERRLIPTFNLASARLLLLSQQSPSGQDQESGTAADIPDGASSSGPSEPQFLDDKELNDIPRGRMTGILNGPQVLPNDDQRIDALWAVCDQYILDPTLNNPAEKNKVETTVLAGVGDLGPELAGESALLVQSPDGVVYLVYRTPGTANFPNTNAVRAKVDMNSVSVRSALDLASQDIRQITVGLLNTITEAPPLTSPGIEGRDGRSEHDVDNLPVGSVFSVDLAGQAVPDYYVLHVNGKERIKSSTANLIRFTKNPRGENIHPVSPDVVARVPDVEKIEDRSYPESVLEVLKAANFPVACLGWSVVGEGTAADVQTAVHVGTEVPLPKKSDGTRFAPIAIGSPSADGQRIDKFFMTPGRAAVVRAADSKEEFQKGTIILVSDRGVKYGVPDVATAAALGLANQKPAPVDILKLLPDGASLNKRDVLQTYDTVAVPQGTFPSQGNQPGGGGAGQAGGSGGG